VHRKATVETHREQGGEGHTQVRRGLKELSREGESNGSEVGDAYEPAVQHVRLVPSSSRPLGLSIATGGSLQM
jgi:hypothetical protein